MIWLLPASGQRILLTIHASSKQNRQFDRIQNIYFLAKIKLLVLVFYDQWRRID